MIDVGRLAPFNQWDNTLLDDLFENALYPTGLDFRRWDGYPNVDGGIILIVPGRYWANQTDQIVEALSRYDWVLGIRCGDEEDVFDIAKVEHPNVKWWIQTPRTDREYLPGTRFIGLGYTPHFRHLPTETPEKRVDVFLSGQDTHRRRHEAFKALAGRADSVVQATDGFTKGLPVDKYRSNMLVAKVAPCPSGAVSPDSFRLYEALEAHCVPIADDVSPAYDSAGYWRMLFPDAPFPVLTDYAQLPGYIDDALTGWPANANRITAWWMLQKRRMVLNLREDLQALGVI